MSHLVLFAVFVFAPGLVRAESVRTAPASRCVCPFLEPALEDAAIGHFVIEPGTREVTFIVETPLLPDATGRTREPGERVEWGRNVPVPEAIGHFVFGLSGHASCAEQLAPASSDPDIAALVALDCSGGRSIEQSGYGMCVERVTVSEVLRLNALRRADPDFDCSSAILSVTDDGCTGGDAPGLVLLGVFAALRRLRWRPSVSGAFDRGDL